MWSAKNFIEKVGKTCKNHRQHPTLFENKIWKKTTEMKAPTDAKGVTQLDQRKTSDIREKRKVQEVVKRKKPRKQQLYT